MLDLELRSREGALRCTYCRDDLPTEGVHACGGCGTILHAACARELSACPTLGCAVEIRGEERLTSLREALAGAERIFRSALQKGDAEARELAWERYTSASRYHREQARSRSEPRQSPTPEVSRPAPEPPLPPFWVFPLEGLWFMWFMLLPSLLLSRWVLQTALGASFSWGPFLGLGLCFDVGFVYLVKALHRAGGGVWRRAFS